MASASTAQAETLAKVAAEVAASCVGPAAATLSAFDSAVETHLGRIDEISALVESVRASRGREGGLRAAQGSAPRCAAALRSAPWRPMYTPAGTFV
jgi:hypothetical protein